MEEITIQFSPQVKSMPGSSRTQPSRDRSQSNGSDETTKRENTGSTCEENRSISTIDEDKDAGSTCGENRSTNTIDEGRRKFNEVKEKFLGHNKKMKERLKKQRIEMRKRLEGQQQKMLAMDIFPCMGVCLSSSSSDSSNSVYTPLSDNAEEYQEESQEDTLSSDLSSEMRPKKSLATQRFRPPLSSHRSKKRHLEKQRKQMLEIQKSPSSTGPWFCSHLSWKFLEEPEQEEFTIISKSKGQSNRRRMEGLSSLAGRSNGTRQPTEMKKRLRNQRKKIQKMEVKQRPADSSWKNKKSLLDLSWDTNSEAKSELPPRVPYPLSKKPSSVHNLVANKVRKPLKLPLEREPPSRARNMRSVMEDSVSVGTCNTNGSYQNACACPADGSQDKSSSVSLNRGFGVVDQSTTDLTLFQRIGEVCENVYVSVFEDGEDDNPPPPIVLKRQRRSNPPKRRRSNPRRKEQELGNATGIDIECCGSESSSFPSPPSKGKGDMHSISSSASFSSESSQESTLFMEHLPTNETIVSETCEKRQKIQEVQADNENTIEKSTVDEGASALSTVQSKKKLSREETEQAAICRPNAAVKVCVVQTTSQFGANKATQGHTSKSKKTSRKNNDSAQQHREKAIHKLDDLRRQVTMGSNDFWKNATSLGTQIKVGVTEASKKANDHYLSTISKTKRGGGGGRQDKKKISGLWKAAGTSLSKMMACTSDEVLMKQMNADDEDTADTTTNSSSTDVESSTNSFVEGRAPSVTVQDLIDLEL